MVHFSMSNAIITSIIHNITSYKKILPYLQNIKAVTTEQPLQRNCLYIGFNVS